MAGLGRLLFAAEWAGDRNARPAQVLGMGDRSSPQAGGPEGTPPTRAACTPAGARARSQLHGDDSPSQGPAGLVDGAHEAGSSHCDVTTESTHSAPLRGSASGKGYSRKANGSTGKVLSKCPWKLHWG